MSAPVSRRTRSTPPARKKCQRWLPGEDPIVRLVKVCYVTPDTATATSPSRGHGQGCKYPDKRRDVNANQAGCNQKLSGADRESAPHTRTSRSLNFKRGLWPRPV